MNQTVVDTQIRSSATPRRGPQLPLLQTSVAKKPSQPLQRHRPTPDDCPESTLRSPLLAKETPHVGHRMLRGGLLGFWGKSKVKRSAAGLESPDPKCGTSISKEKVSLGEATLFTVARKSSVAQDPVAVQTESGGQEPPVKRRSQKTTKRRDSFKKDLVQNKSVSWNPPPLFQAYPQAVKHAALAMPPTSADTILRLQSEKKRKDRRKANDMDQADSSNIDNSARHNEDTDASCSGIWLPKVFILATSGYFLQYAGEGKFDRLPEKIMPIGKDSAAFASDAIPGKHWVLQVSHLSDENGTSTPQSHNQIFKNLRFRGEMARRTASNMLLVFENPEDLDSWLVVVRKEIEALGGRKYCREGKDWLPEGSQGLHQRPSVRYLVKRDPNQFSSISKDLGHNVRDGEVNHDSLHLDSVQKPSSGLHESFHSPPVSSTTASTDHNTLERLRLSPRVSYISASAKTFSTSARTSPGVSPIRAEFRLPDLAFSNNEIPMPGSTDFTSARNSFPNETQEKSESRPPTALSQPSPDPLAASKHTLSPGAPNFSIPSFCKRYSSASSTPPLSKRSSFKSTNSRVEASLRIPSVPRAGVTECDTTDETPVCSTAQVPPPLDLESGMTPNFFNNASYQKSNPKSRRAYTAQLAQSTRGKLCTSSVLISRIFTRHIPSQHISCQHALLSFATSSTTKRCFASCA